MGGGHSFDRTMCRSLNIILNNAVLTLKKDRVNYYLFLYLLTVSDLTITTIDDTTPDTGKTSSYNYVKSTKARIKRKIILIAYFAHFMLRGVD